MELEWFNVAATAAEVETADPPIDGLLDPGAMSVLYGDSNSGKTFVALDMAYMTRQPLTVRSFRGDPVAT
jgi:hypothetical protein